MFGKFFASAFTGSMTGAGVEVFAVWGYVIANAVNGQVELNPRVVASLLGTTDQAVVDAIAYLCRPDPSSRSPADDGRRLVKEGAFAYRVVNHAAYRSIRDENDRREYNRRKKAEGRSRGVNTRVKRSTRESKMSAQAEAEAEADTETDTKTTTSRKGRVTWVTPYWTAWLKQYGGEPAGGQLAKALKPLHDAHGETEVLTRWRRYLETTEARYASPQRFAQTWGAWANGNGPQQFSYTPGVSGPAL